MTCTSRKLRVNISFQRQLERQQVKTATVLHQYFYICEMIICLLSLTQDHVKTTGCFFFKNPTASKHFCTGWQQVHHGNCPSPAQKKKWLPKRSDSGGCVLCEWVHRRQLSIDVAEEDWQRQSAREKDLFLLLSWQTFISNHAFPLGKPIRRNMLAFIIYTNPEKATPNRQQTLAITLVTTLPSRLWSQSLMCQIQTEKSVTICVINKDRWFKQVRKILTLDKQ